VHRSFYINCNFFFCFLKKISVRNGHPLLDAGIVNQYVQIIMIPGNPIKKFLALSW